MEVYATEEQQLEAMKRWWKENGKSMIFSVLTVIALYFAWTYWKHHKENVLEKASEQYSSMLTSYAQADFKSTEYNAEILMNDYEKTPYAPLARLTLVKQAVQDKDYDLAKSHLSWVVDNSNAEDLRHIAKTRYVRILIEEEKFVEAMNYLQKHKEIDGYQTLMEELVGDVYFAQKDEVNAKAAYKKAIALDPSQGNGRPLLMMKAQQTGALNATDSEIG